MELSILLYTRCVSAVTYVTFYHLKLSHYSKVYVHSYSFHEGLSHDLMLIGLKYISFLISHIYCVCSHLLGIVKHFLQGHYLLIAYTTHSFMNTQRPKEVSVQRSGVDTIKYHSLLT